MNLIPAIDIIEGKCVRLSKGDYETKKIYNENPLEVAKSFEDAGITNLHLVDLDGAKNSKIINYKTLEIIANKTNLKIDFGGGIKSDEDLKIAFDSGANQITVGSIAAKDPEKFLEWLSIFGNQKIILGADALDQKIALQGWLEKLDWDLFDFVDYYTEKGVKYCICTDISKDGMLKGPNFKLYNKLKNEFEGLNIIASGGIHHLDDLYMLKEINVHATIIGKAIYEGKITLKEMEQFILNQ